MLSSITSCFTSCFPTGARNAGQHIATESSPLLAPEVHGQGDSQVSAARAMPNPYQGSSSQAVLLARSPSIASTKSKLPTKRSLLQFFQRQGEDGFPTLKEKVIDAYSELLLLKKPDSRRSIAVQQDAALAAEFAEKSARLLPRDFKGPSRLTVVATDVLDTKTKDGAKRAVPIDPNGSGFIGLTNLGKGTQKSILASIKEIGDVCKQDSVVLVVCSKTRKEPNHMIHEKALTAQMIGEKLEEKFSGVNYLTMETMKQKEAKGEWPNEYPTVVLDYMGDLLDPETNVTKVVEGKHYLLDHQINVVYGSRYLCNVNNTLGKLNTTETHCVNEFFVEEHDKTLAYQRNNEFTEDQDGVTNYPLIGAPIVYFPISMEGGNEEAAVKALIEKAKELCLENDNDIVLKPSDTTHSKGIRYLWGKNETAESIEKTVNESLAEAKKISGGFPYALMEYYPPNLIQDESNPHLHNHQGEGRYITYLHPRTVVSENELEVGDKPGDIRWFASTVPGIYKVAPQATDTQKPLHERSLAELTNNVTASAGSGADHVLALCNKDTIAKIGSSVAEELQKCKYLTDNTVWRLTNNLDG